MSLIRAAALRALVSSAEGRAVAAQMSVRDRDPVAGSDSAIVTPRTDRSQPQAADFLVATTTAAHP